MQSTGHSSMHALSLTSTQGWAITYVTGTPSRGVNSRNRRRLGQYPSEWRCDDDPVHMAEQVARRESQHRGSKHGRRTQGTTAGLADLADRYPLSLIHISEPTR